MKRGLNLPTLEPERPSRAPWALGALALAVGYLAYRKLRRDDKATQGHSPVASVRHGEGIKVTRLVTIAKEPAELYAFWRDFANLPRFMRHLEQVEVLSPQRSRWTTAGPLGKRVTWEAVIHNDVPNELIAWRTIEGSNLVSAGSIHFEEGPVGRGTTVRVKLQYDPPGGKLGAAFAWAFGDSPSQVIREGLRRFKQLMETGEIPTTDGQARGHR